MREMIPGGRRDRVSPATSIIPGDENSADPQTAENNNAEHELVPEVQTP